MLPLRRWRYSESIMSIDANSRFKPSPGVHARRFDNELVILDLKGGEYFGLDAIGAEIWERLALGRCVAEVARELVERYDVEYAVLEDDVRTLAATLVSRGLVSTVAP
jgi:hypothetical protein